MATRIIEYGGTTRTDGMQSVPLSINIQAALTATGTSQQSPATSPGTNMICVQSDETIHVARGSNPTATTDNYKIKAGNEQFFDNTPGHKIAIITGT